MEFAIEGDVEVRPHAKLYGHARYNRQEGKPASGRCALTPIAKARGPSRISLGTAPAGVATTAFSAQRYFRRAGSVNFGGVAKAAPEEGRTVHIKCGAVCTRHERGRVKSG